MVCGAGAGQDLLIGCVALLVVECFRERLRQNLVVLDDPLLVLRTQLVLVLCLCLRVAATVKAPWG